MYHQLLIVPQSPANAYQVDADTQTLLTCAINSDGTVSTNLADWAKVTEVPGEFINHLLEIVRVLAPNPFLVMHQIKLV